MKILSVNTAATATRLIQGRSIATAIGKQPVAGQVAVGPLGLAGDEQADQSVHGGLSKAVYLYPVVHHPFWQTVRAQAGAAAADAPIAPGLFGENLTVEGVDESQLWIGDQLRLPGCTLVVSEPRNPCFKFNAVMGFSTASKLMAVQARCGFYLSVAQPGTLTPGESFALEAGQRALSIQHAITGKLAKHLR